MQAATRATGAILLLAGALLAPAGAEDARYHPIRLTFGVKGLTLPETRDALVKALKGLEAVETATTEVEKVTVQVRAEKTFRLSDLASAVQGLATGEKPLVLERDALRLTGRAWLKLSGMGEAKDDALMAALKTVPNVVKVEGTGAKYLVELDGSKGATVAEVEAGLKAALGAPEGGPVPGLADVLWVGPRRPQERRPPRPGGTGGGGAGG